MAIGDEKNYPFFEPDEYTFINKTYFSSIPRGDGAFEPSGWIETWPEAASFVRRRKRGLSLRRYYMDEGSALGLLRVTLHRLLQAWEGRELDASGFTTCPSVGVASFLTLAVLRRNGVKRILFETPCYFAAILQAEWLGFEVVLIPTYFRDHYRRPAEFGHAKKAIPSVWWITHPRVTLGFNQDIEGLSLLIGELSSKDYLVIDEALDQSFPAEIGSTSFCSEHKRVIRLRSFTKPLGLNGYRLAFVLHDATLRAKMIDNLETFAGAVDAYSLAAAQSLSESPEELARLLRAANQQTVALCLSAIKLASKPAVRVNPLVNGYLGSAVLNLEKFGGNQMERRHRFLLGCQKNEMPVIIGPSMHFASDPPLEMVRLNFFNKAEHMLRCIAILSRLVDEPT